MCWARFGRTKSRTERGRRPKSNSAGVMPVVECGVMRKWNKNFDNRSSSDPLVIFLIDVLMFGEPVGSRMVWC